MIFPSPVKRNIPNLPGISLPYLKRCTGGDADVQNGPAVQPEGVRPQCPGREPAAEDFGPGAGAVDAAGGVCRPVCGGLYRQGRLSPAPDPAPGEFTGAPVLGHRLPGGAGGSGGESGGEGPGSGGTGGLLRPGIWPFPGG